MVDNCLAIKYPDIAKEWHPTKNGNLMPTDVTAGSAQKVWWKCTQGHELVRHISVRTSAEPLCSFCQGTRKYKGVDDKSI